MRFSIHNPIQKAKFSRPPSSWYVLPPEATILPPLFLYMLTLGGELNFEHKIQYKTRNNGECYKKTVLSVVKFGGGDCFSGGFELFLYTVRILNERLL